ncbi:MAG: tetratricopeptide repeat protein, partial [Pseudomonadota bacterium]
VASHGERFDLIVCESGPEGAPNADWFSTLFSCLRVDGALLITPAPGHESAFAEGSSLIDRLTRNFVEVDHREITHHFPDAEIGPHASEIYSIERFRDGVLIHRAPNDYPSNFDFTLENPQSKAVRERILEVLEDEPSAGGLLTMVETLRRERKQEEQRPLIEQLDTMDVVTFKYFMLSADQARRDGNPDRAADLYRRALAEYPFDPEFSVQLAREYTRENRIDEAIALLESSRDTHERPRDVYLPLARLYDRLESKEAAIEAYGAAWRRTPRHRRPPIRIRLSELLLEKEDRAGAERELRGALEADPEDAPSLIALSKLLFADEKREEALALAGDAAKFDPENKTALAWLAQING